MTTLLDAARSGMIEHERNVERISNNIANINTAGYKKIRVQFSDVFDTQTYLDLVTGLTQPAAQQTSTAVVGGSESRDFSLGVLRVSDRALDLAIDGDGFFEVRLPDGATGYTRDGTLWPDADGDLVTINGYRLQPPISLPAGARDIVVGPDGAVSALVGDAAERTEIGAITLVRFSNPSGLESRGENLYATTEASGPGATGAPGDSGFGELRSGFLEASNVDLAEEMANLMMAQRAYQLNASLYRYADQMYQQATELTA